MNVKMSSPELVECEHFRENNSKIHNGILLLALAYHMTGFFQLQHFLLQDVFLPILRPSVRVFPHYQHKYFILILIIQVLTHQDLKDPNCYVSDNSNLTPIVNYRKLSIYGNLLNTFRGVQKAHNVF